MSLTTSFLYHFTGGKLDAIKGILQTGYRVTFSDEAEYVTFPDGIYKFRRAIPMVCFCDLPIFEIRSHAIFYSNSDSEIFGFGMKRDWAVRNQLNPIIYVSPGSYVMTLFAELAIYLRSQMEIGLKTDVFHGQNRDVLNGLEGYAEFRDMIQGNDYINNFNFVTGVYPQGNNNFEGPHEDVSRFELFYKPTHGIYPRNGQEIPDHPYYFEREWRYIPENLHRFICCVEKEGMVPSAVAIRDNYERMLQTHRVHSQLTFTAEDIDQIIVDTEASKRLLEDAIMDPAFTRVGGSQAATDGQKAELIAKIKVWEEIQVTDIH